MEQEEAEELFYLSDDFQRDDEGEVVEKVEQYALQHSSPVQIEGYRAGLNNYPESRDMKPAAYAEWLGYRGGDQRTWLSGYNDALQEEK